MAEYFRLQDRPALLIAPGFILAALLGAFSYRSALNYRHMMDWVNHTHHVLLEVRTLVSELYATESAQRGYLITGDNKMLERAKNGVNDLAVMIFKLRETVSDNPEQVRRAGAIAPVLHRRLSLLSEALDVERTQGKSAALRLVKTNGSANLMEVLSSALSEIERDEFMLLKDRSEEARRDERYVVLLILLSCGLSLCTLWLAALVLRRELNARNRALEEKEKAKQVAVTALEARSVFLANMSHEIRTPLHSIVGMADVLAGETTPEEDQKGLEIIRRSAGLLMNLINDILDLSKIEADKIEFENIPFALRDLLEQTVQMVAFRASQKGLVMVSRFADDLPESALGDPNRIRQVLLNLLSNAIKFTDQGSVQLFATSARREDGQFLLQLVVADTGKGIKPEKFDRVFQEFSQLDPATARTYGGTGLGLTISKKLVAGMGGTIRFESQVGIGTKFVVELAMREAHVQLESLERSNAQALGTYPLKRLLIVDDLEDNRLLLQMYLRELPLQLSFAKDGGEAIRLAQMLSPEVILMDLHMPGTDGLEATRQIRSDEASSGRPKAHIIAVTANALRHDSDKALAAGCDGHLSKPLNRETLLRALYAAARTSPAPDSSVVHVRRDLEGLVPAFIQNRKKELQQLRDCLQAGDLISIRELAHAIAGVSGSFGFALVAELSRALETAAVQGDHSRIAALSQSLFEHFDQLTVKYY